ncbi:hypothetical protein FPV67DRAFT_1673406 [Lyophyllum atratum]|nr:hypothetical protein FPV67DRAFT_1673406 [Lyophyllum atratum]
MSPEEEVLFQILGISLLSSIGAIAAIAFLHGFFTLLFAILILRKSTWSSGQALLAMSIISFLIATAYWAIYLAYLTTMLRTALVDNMDMPVVEKRALANFKTYKINIAMTWISQLMPIINDMVIIWRGRILFPEQRWTGYVTLFLWTATVAVTFTQFGLVSNFAGFRTFVTSESKVTTSLFTASISLSLVTNAVTTGCIAYGVWKHRKLVASHLDKNDQGSRVQKILNILVDSGVLYCGLQFVTLILNAFPLRKPYTTLNFTAIVFFGIYTELSAMYPTLVMFLAKGQQSFMESHGRESDGGPHPASGPQIVFASKPMENLRLQCVSVFRIPQFSVMWDGRRCWQSIRLLAKPLSIRTEPIR